jgi:hypothetical protein
MSRRLIILIVAIAALTGAGFGAYALFFKGEPPPKPPVFDDDTTKPLSPAEEFEKLARENPVAMLGQCLSRYNREVKGGIRFTLEKQERVKGKPKHPEMPPVEIIDVCVRGDVPDPETHKTAIEVVMKWKSGAKKPFGFGAEIRGSFFSEKLKAEGGLDDKVITWRPEATIGPKMSSPVEPNVGAAKDQSRYCIRDAGLFRSMLRTHEAWKIRQDSGELKCEYLGKKTLPQIGRECHVIKRICPRTEIDAFEVGGAAGNDPNVVSAEGFTEVTIYIDTERWLQVGTELYRTEPDGTRVLVGAYYMRDVQLSPSFQPDTFTADGLKK